MGLQSLPPRVRTVLALGCALAVVSVEWGITFRFFGEQSLSAPITYSNDGLFAAAVIKAASKFEYLPFMSKAIPSLGAPAGAQWDDYPFNDDVFIFGFGVVARVAGVFAAMNLVFLGACWLAAISMFWVCRRLHFSRSGSMLASILFGFSMFAVARNVSHLGLTLYFSTPLAILLAAWLASRKGIQFKTPKFYASVAICVLLSWSFIYLFIFALELWAVASAAGFLKNASKQRAVVTLTLVFVAFAGALSMNFETVVSRAAFGVNTRAVQRNPADVEKFALKPINLIVPAGSHRFELMRELAVRAQKSSLINGEHPSPYLGMVGAVLLLALFAQTLRASAARPRFVMAWASSAAFFIILHSVGGVGSLLGVFEIYVLRSTNRASIYVLAFAALFGAQMVPRLMRRVPSGVAFVACLALGVFGSWEAVPRPKPLELMRADWQRAAADKQLVEEAERVLPAGTKVFELPVVEFPEGRAVGTVGTYDLFRPYIFSTQLTFSHGDLKGSEESQLKDQAAHLPAAQMIDVLQKLGFGAIYVNLGGFTDVASLEAAGATIIARANDSLFLKIDQNHQNTPGSPK